MLKEFRSDVLETFPAPCKTYEAGLPVVELPLEWSVPGHTATAVLSGQFPAEPAALNISLVARVLHLSAGVIRLAERSDGRRYMFRASGSAGGRFPLELYLAALDTAGMPDDEPFRTAVREHLEFGTHVAMQNSNAATDDELHPLREVPTWTWDGDE